MSTAGAGDVDPKYPSWSGDWNTFTDYVLRVELRADSTKEDDLPQLGPRLAQNLTGRAFECLGDIDRTKLKKGDGWSYLIQHLEQTRGKTKLDLLGDTFTEFFLKKDAYRRDGEEINDFETRFRALVRKIEKALKAVGSEGKVPTEVYGWFLLNVFMKLEPSDTANVRGTATSYKLEDVLKALHTMWSGASLAQRDTELKKRRQATGTYHQDYTEGDAEIFNHDEDPEDAEAYDEADGALEEAATWYQDVQFSIQLFPKKVHRQSIIFQTIIISKSNIQSLALTRTLLFWSWW